MGKPHVGMWQVLPEPLLVSLVGVECDFAAQHPEHVPSFECCWCLVIVAMLVVVDGLSGRSTRAWTDKLGWPPWTVHP